VCEGSASRVAAKVDVNATEVFRQELASGGIGPISPAEFASMMTGRCGEGLQPGVAAGAAEALQVEPELLACPHCASIQTARRQGASVVQCRTCRSELQRRTGRTLDAALAAASGTFLLLFPANGLVFLQTAIAGSTRHSYLASGALELWREGWSALALVVLLVLVVAPLVRFGLLSVVLGAVRLGCRSAWVGPAFRAADRLQPWAMVEVGIVALWIAISRLTDTVPTRLGAGGMCFAAAGVLALVSRATLDKAVVWRAIGDQPPLEMDAPLLSCRDCGLLVPAERGGQACIRCRAKLQPRQPGAARRAAAFTLAGVALYAPANLFPMATVPVGLEPGSYTVLQGVKDLFAARLWGLGLLVFSASFAVPLIKLLGMGWLVASVWEGSRRRLIAKTRVYRMVEEIGRWSMVDVLVIALFVPVIQFNAKLYGRAEPAATAFAAVVVLTMLATQVFDPRCMWDAAGERG
jgi:paraquat-inducible protein A